MNKIITVDDIVGRTQNLETITQARGTKFHVQMFTDALFNRCNLKSQKIRMRQQIDTYAKSAKALRDSGRKNFSHLCATSGLILLNKSLYNNKNLLFIYRNSSAVGPFVFSEADLQLFSEQFKSLL